MTECDKNFRIFFYSNNIRVLEHAMGAALTSCCNGLPHLLRPKRHSCNRNWHKFTLLRSQVCLHSEFDWILDARDLQLQKQVNIIYSGNFM